MVKELLPDLISLIRNLTLASTALLKFGLGPIGFALKQITGPLSLVADGVQGVADAFKSLETVELKNPILAEGFLEKRRRELDAFRKGDEDKGVGGLTLDERLFQGGFGGGADPKKRFAREAREKAARANRAPTTQKGTLQKGLDIGVSAGAGFGGIVNGIGVAVATALSSPPVVEALSRPALALAGPRSGFADLGVKIQDALLQADKDALDKERNGILNKQLSLSEQIVNAVKEQDKRLGLS